MGGAVSRPPKEGVEDQVDMDCGSRELGIFRDAQFALDT